MRNKLTIIILSLAFFCGCSKTTASLGGVEPYDTTLGSRSGYERWTFLKLLDGINSREHYVISARFFDAEGELTLHSHFNGFQFRDGLRVRFVKKAASPIEVEIGGPGVLPFSTSVPALGIGSDQTLRVRVEVHDGVSPGARVLIWSDEQSLQGEVQTPRTLLNARTSAVDTSALGWAFETHGRGARWGIETSGVTISRAYREAPYVE